MKHLHTNIENILTGHHREFDGAFNNVKLESIQLVLDYLLSPTLYRAESLKIQ